MKTSISAIAINGIRLLLLSITILFSSNISAGVQEIYFVSNDGNDNNSGTLSAPFATLQKARDVVRTINDNMTGDIIIYIRGGVYELENTFTLSKEDSGTNGYNIIYLAYEDEIPVISGGTEITTWTIHDTGKNIYKTFVGTSFDTRQLWVNGVRAIRARSVDASGWSEIADGYICPAHVAEWENIINIEVVSRKEWKCHRGPVAQVIGLQAIMAQPYWEDLHKQYDAPPAWIENAYELLDDEGEWYLNRSSGILYYKPRPGEDMTKVKVVFPRIETLVSGSNLSHVKFMGMTFSYATWLLPNSPKGFPCVQADLTYSGQIPGNIAFSHSSNLWFEGNTFEHLGVTGLQLSDGCKNNMIYNNIFDDISGSAISIGSLSNENPSVDDIIKDNTVDNNLITNAALEYEGCVGVLAGYTEHTIIRHNEIRHLPYSGISAGWGWSNTIIAGKNNEISYNLIDSVVMQLRDGGGIYTLSSQPGAHVHDNYINHQFNEFGSLYPDEGSSNMHWHNNVVSNSVRWLHMWIESIQNDTVDFNYYDTPNQTTNGTNCVIQNNMFISDGNWPVEAQTIINNAGRVNTEVRVTEVLVTPSAITINIGDSSKLASTIIPYNSTDKKVYWSSSNSFVATVSQEGKVKALDAGEVIVTATTQDGTKTDNCLVRVSAVSDVVTHNQGDVKIYPNPVSGCFIINSSKEFINVEIYNMHGKLIHTTRESTVNISHFSKGCYIIRLTGEDWVYIEKFIKE